MKTQIALLLLSLISINVNSQQVSVPKALNGTGQEIGVKNSAIGIPCYPNVFWGAAGTAGGTVDELTISGGSVVVLNASVVTTSGDANLAYCNNLNGSSFSPTFYSSNFSREPRYYDFGTWDPSSFITTPNRIQNCGANGNFLYYVWYDSTSVSLGIARYFSNGMSPVYLWPSNRKLTVGDLEVDNSGNVWFFTGPTSSGTVLSDSLLVVSPGGNVLRKFSTNFVSTNSYGMLLLNSTLYVAFGAGHPTFPNTLVPVLLSGNTASLGTPLSMPVPNPAYNDLAGCNVGTPLALGDITATNTLNIYPNPIVDRINIFLPDNLNGNMNLSIQDAAGKIVFNAAYSGKQKDDKIEINCSHFAQGNYIIQLQAGDETFSSKIVKY
ncbi:MAG: T9SS type A sorting domain-containing protein [Bacteroidetes bacterium]|nr:T9SS type A sorting domain-containing protein [Bacteroidota bacterium]